MLVAIIESERSYSEPTQLHLGTDIEVTFISQAGRWNDHGAVIYVGRLVAWLEATLLGSSGTRGSW
jgi:hypothetical protein